MTAERPLRILVVDDGADFLRALRRVLRDYEVATVDDTRSALTIIRAGARFDAIISDFDMPHLDGQAFFEALCVEVPDQARRVIYLTGALDRPSAQAFFSTIDNQRLQKPASVADLRAAIHRSAQSGTSDQREPVVKVVT